MPNATIETLGGERFEVETYAIGDTLFPLTPCCNATATGSVGSPTGTACRSCYAPIDPVFGAPIRPAALRI